MASAAAILAIVVVGVPLLAYLLQDRLLFHPQPLTAPERAAVLRQFPAAREIFIDSPDGKRLHAWHVPAAPGAPLVLYFSGNAENVAWMTADAAARTPGRAWLLVDYRGYGGSEGEPSEVNIKADALRWYDYARAELKPSRMAVFGRSLGTGAAVYVASQRPVSGVVLATPYDSMVEVARHHYPFLPVGLLLRHRFDSIGLAPRIPAPLLCIAAQRDAVVPPSHARKLYDAWGGEKRWIELTGAGHNSTDDVPLFWGSIRTFLQESGT